MTTKLRERRVASHGAPRRRPDRRAGAHTGALQRALGAALRCSPKAAEHRLRETERVLAALPAAARAIDDGGIWLRLWAARHDVTRAAMAAIPYDLSTLAYVARADTREDDALIAHLADPAALAPLEALESALAREIALKSEALDMIRAEIARRRSLQ